MKQTMVENFRARKSTGPKDKNFGIQSAFGVGEPVADYSISPGKILMSVIKLYLTGNDNLSLLF